MQLVDPVDNVGLFLVCQNLPAPGKERLACSGNTTVEFKLLLEFEDIVVEPSLPCAPNLDKGG
jgi:hypothetical protein